MHAFTLKYDRHDEDVLSLIVQVANGAFSGEAQVYSPLTGPPSRAKAVGRGSREPCASCEVSLGTL